MHGTTDVVLSFVSKADNAENTTTGTIRIFPTLKTLNRAVQHLLRYWYSFHFNQRRESRGNVSEVVNRKKHDILYPD